MFLNISNFYEALQSSEKLLLLRDISKFKSNLNFEIILNNITKYLRKQIFVFVEQSTNIHIRLKRTVYSLQCTMYSVVII